MSDAQRALDDFNALMAIGDHSTEGIYLGCNLSSHRMKTTTKTTIRRALRLLAAVEAGEWKVVPIKATAENGMKYNLIGEFKYNRRTYADDDGEEHDIKFELTWPETKETYDKMLQAAPDFFAGEKEE